jgi:hypothetical protein
MKFIRTENCSQKVVEFIDYFTGAISKNKIDKSKNRAYKLERVIEIYQDKEKLEIDKIREISEYYKNSATFIKAYADIMKYDSDPIISPFIGIIYEIGSFFIKCEENDLIRISKDLKVLEEAGYYDDYFGACQLIERYIDYNDSPYLKDFLEDYNVDEYSFKRCVDIVKALDGDLYNAYEEKNTKNQKERKIRTFEKINNLFTGIKTGSLPNGEEFNRIEAYRNLPFYDEITAKECIEDFNVKSAPFLTRKIKLLLESIEPYKSTAIMNYLYQEDLIGSTNPSLITEDDIYKTLIIYDGKEMTKEDKQNILGYMKQTRVPFLSRAFNEVRKEYYNGNIKRNKIEKRMVK